MSEFKNRLLSVLSPSVRQSLLPFLKRRNFQRYELLEEPPEPAQRALFIEEGVACVLTSRQPGSAIDVGMIGREGMTGASLVHGIHPTLLPVEARTDGWGYEIQAGDLLPILRQQPEIRTCFERYNDWRQFQSAMLAASGRLAHLERNLARLLLMLHDRLDSSTIHITHDELARHLHVRRSGVTNGTHLLEGCHLIQSTRGVVIITDRRGLEAFAGEFYGKAESAWWDMLSHISHSALAAE